MSRNIPIALQSNLDSAVQTVARCVRITTRGGLSLGFTTWDSDITYDHMDGHGPVTYSASQGIDPSQMVADTEYNVANAEGRILVSTTLSGLTLEMVQAGHLDDAQWASFLLDWTNPLPGSAAVLDAGDVGEVRIEDGMVIIPELLSYAMRLRQAVGHVWQRPCRAVFGTPAPGHTGCGVDAEALWATGSITSVGAESDRTFTGTVPGHFPGRVELLDGPNAGKRYAVESFDGTTVTLADTVPFLLTAGTAYRIRPDCAKTPAACKGYGNYLNYKGEDLIPVGDAAAGATPGAQMPGGGGWVGETAPTVAA